MGKLLYTARKFHLRIPFGGMARPQSQFPHSCIYERLIYSQDRSTYCIFLQQNRQTDPGNILFAHRHMNVKIGSEAGAIPRKGIHKWDFRCSVGIPENSKNSTIMCGGGGSFLVWGGGWKNISGGGGEYFRDGNESVLAKYCRK
jgi:hypothetical protein